LTKTLIGRLNGDGVEDVEVNIGGAQRFDHCFTDSQRLQCRVDDKQRLAGAQFRQVHADLARRARTEADARGGHLKGAILSHGCYFSGRLRLSSALLSRKRQALHCYCSSHVTASSIDAFLACCCTAWPLPAA